LQISDVASFIARFGDIELPYQVHLHCAARVRDSELMHSHISALQLKISGQ
jgi:hypothetical protein